MDSDEEDFVFYGTPIEREEDNTSRKKKAVAEASGQLRTLPAWKQEVRDEEGRRRFHGAFTGGFSAGYYNTAGSKEGWTPQTFVSSRKNRAEVKQQSFLNFLDEDERAELEGQSLGTSSQFDTFGFTAAELACKQAEKEQQQRPSAIPGPVPDELVLPATESIGVKLLLKMGWRRGRSIKDSHSNSTYEARREARKAFLALSSDDAKAEGADFESVHGDLEQHASDDVPSSQGTHVYALTPKQDLHGLGFDPYKNAPEFRERKRLRENRNSGYKKAHNNLFGFKSGKAAPGFGIGALEDFDAEDEDVFAVDYDFEETYVKEIDEPTAKPKADSKLKLITNGRDVLPGFRLASNSDYQPERFDPPLVPKDFVPHHKFPGPLRVDYKVTDPSPQEVPPPEDNNLKLLIEGVATLVAQCGKLFEELSREKNQNNPLFSFLFGGNGHDYYARKLWEARQKQSDKTNLLEGKLSPKTQKLTAESRGNILGERPLERSSKDASSSVAPSDSINLQYNLSDTFTKPASLNDLPEAAKPFKEDPAKQQRFEQFLKEKYRGGLRTTESGGASYMSEAARARERVDFEAAAEAIEKGKWGKEGKMATPQIVQFLATSGMQFTSGGSEKVGDIHAEDPITKKMYPKREEFQWRPSPILCKRFDLIDPFMGKPPPAPRMRSKMDSLIFTSDSAKAKNMEETIVVNRDSFSMPQSDTQGSKDVADMEMEVEVQVENVERPVDLYKAIFSDDSDDEEDTTTSLNKVEDPEKKVEAANTTLSRLMAGDFLESLGKELGLEVPPDQPYSTNKAKGSASQKEEVSGNSGNDKLPPVDGIPTNQEIARDGRYERNELLNNNSVKSSSKHDRSDLFEDRYDQVKSEKKARHRSLSRSSSSEDERSRRHSRRRSHKSSDLDSDSSNDHHGRHHSRSKRRKKKSSREKSSSSQKHSKHRRKGSPSRSHNGSEKEHSEARREKHRRSR